MGWSCFPKPDDVVAELQRNMNWESDTCVYRCLRGAFVGITYYAAVERVMKADGKRCVFAMITLVRYHPTRWHGGKEMCTKDMDEGMGPCEDKCPKSILDLLTPVESDAGSYAQDWRDRCYRYHELKAQPVNDDDVRRWALESRGIHFDHFSDKYKKIWRNAYRKRFMMNTQKETA